MQKLKRKQVLIITVLIACTTNLHAQNIIIHLPTDRRLSVRKPVPYNSVILLDNRYYKTPLKIINNGNFSVQYISFDSFAIEIKNYIENLSKGKKHKQDTLYVDLRDFRSNAMMYALTDLKELPNAGILFDGDKAKVLIYLIKVC